MNPDAVNRALNTAHFRYNIRTRQWRYLLLGSGWVEIGKDQIATLVCGREVFVTFEC